VGLAFNPARLTREDSVPTLHHAAPNFTRMTINHTPVKLSFFRGKVALLDFWASWCAPCLVKTPHFVEWQRDYGPLGLQVIGISMDDDETSTRTIYTKY
jgi:thiol-disulfide isomerase/thioredoxin